MAVAVLVAVLPKIDEEEAVKMFDNDIAKAGCWEKRRQMEAMRIGAIRTVFLELDVWPCRSSGCSERSCCRRRRRPSNNLGIFPKLIIVL